MKSALTAPRRPRPARRPANGELPAAAEADASEAADPESAGRVLQQFRVIFNAVKAHFQQVERSAGIGGAQVWALSIISDRAGLGVNELAARLSVRQPTASILVRNLVQQGLVEARRDGPDRRAVQLHVLPEGRRVLRTVPGPYAGVLPQALATLDGEALRRLETDLSQLIRALGADDRAAGIPLAQL